MSSPPQSSNVTSAPLRTPSPRGKRPILTREPTRNRVTPSQRLPPPTLFQGPPSRNTSVISVSLPGEAPKDHPDGRGATTAASRAPLGSPNAPQTYPSTSLRQPPTQADDFHAENLWAEMQQTLADVQLSAISSNHVFGAEHAKALEDLRTAQLSLAQAWAKSQTDEIVDNDLLDDDDADNVVSAGLTDSAKEAAPPGGGTKTAESATAQQSSQNLADETKEDIRRARRRKEANDRYFQRVNQGVLDVVSKLDGVANAMRRVQKKSRDLWEHASTDTDDDSVGSESGDDLDGRSPDSPPSTNHQTIKGK